MASKCIELAGGMGFVRELGIEKYYRDCKIGQIYEVNSKAFDIILIYVFLFLMTILFKIGLKSLAPLTCFSSF